MVTEQVLAEQILASLPQPILVIAAGGRIMTTNLAAEEFFATGREHIKRQTLEMVLPFGSPVNHLIENCLNTLGHYNEYGIDLSTPRTGSGRMVDLQVAPLVLDDEAHALLVIQPRAIADKIDRQLTHRGAARSVSAMSAMLAHEIKNPLSGIRGAAQLIEPHLPSHQQELSQLICDETDRIAGLVNRFEVFSDTPISTMIPVNMHSVLIHVKTLAKTGFGENIRFIEDYDPSLPPVLGERDLLIQVFLNLVKNAAEAVSGRENGEIKISSSFRPGVRLAVPKQRERVSLPLEFKVTDNGNGIPPDIQHYIFDPFVTSKSGGTGLGLALVAKIIGDHGGIVEYETTPGNTSFRVLLPMAMDATETKEAIDILEGRAL